MAPPTRAHSPRCEFAYSSQHTELWFTYGAISSPTTTTTTCGWFAYGTTHSPRCEFPYSAQHTELWFTYGANSTPSTTLVQVSAKPPLHLHLWAVPSWLSWAYSMCHDCHVK